jgi:hypothetical protein
MLRVWVSLLIFAALAAGAVARAGGLDDLRGGYAFDFDIDPATTHCAPVTGALLAQFKSAAYACDMKGSRATSTQAFAISCTSHDGKHEYLNFKTKTLCENERLTQESNGG